MSALNMASQGQENQSTQGISQLHAQNEIIYLKGWAPGLMHNSLIPFPSFFSLL
jgi:hypothetical protein